VSIYINGQLFYTSTLNGSGQLIVTEPTGTDPKANYTVYATYAGSSSYGASTSNTVTLTVD
jgi:enterochelin esterase-like enzyme